MGENRIKNGINDLRKNASEIWTLLANMMGTDAYRERGWFSSSQMEQVAAKCESSALMARALLSEAEPFRVGECVPDKAPPISCTVRVEVFETEYGLCVDMPRMVSKSAGSGNAKAFYDTYVRPEVERYLCAHPFSLPQFVLVYEHRYEKLTGKGVKDHDNIETKSMTDIIMRCMGTDDHPLYCRTFVWSKESPEARTRMHVIRPGMFLDYLRKEAGYASGI